MKNEKNGGGHTKPKSNRLDLSVMFDALKEVAPSEFEKVEEKAFNILKRPISKKRAKSENDVDMKGKRQKERTSLRVKEAQIKENQKVKLPVVSISIPRSRSRSRPESNNQQIELLYDFLTKNQHFTIEENKENEFRKYFYTNMGIKKENKLGKLLGFLVQYLVKEKLIDEEKLNKFYNEYKNKKQERVRYSDASRMPSIPEAAVGMQEGGVKSKKRVIKTI